MTMIDDTCLRCRRPHNRTFQEPFCPACVESAKLQEEEDRKQEHEAALAKREKRWAALCAAEYRETDVTRLPAAAQMWAQKLQSWDPGKTGLTIHGPTGRGKTRLAWIAMRSAFEKGRRLGFVAATEIRVRLFTGWDQAGKLLDEASKPDVLLLDDLGQGSKSEQADSLILSILERRTREQRPTIVTTQYDSRSIQARFFSVEIAEAIIRRIGKSFATSCDLGQTE